MNYSTKDIFLARRTENQTFEEYQLHVQPNSMVVSDATGNLAMVDTSSLILATTSASYAVSASWAPMPVILSTNSASWASASLSASYAPFTDNPNATSASWVSASAFITTAQTASYLSASVTGVGIFTIQYITSASYAALSPPNPTTLYVISSSVII